MRISFKFIALSFIFIAFSCQKKTPDQNPENPPAIEQEQKIKSFSAVMYTLDASTLKSEMPESKKIVTLNQQQKITKIEYLYYQNGIIDDSRTRYREYTYDSQGNILSLEQFSGIYKDLQERYTYDTQGKLIQLDSLYGEELTATYKYKYNNLGQIDKVEIYKDGVYDNESGTNHFGLYEILTLEYDEKSYVKLSNTLYGSDPTIVLLTDEISNIYDEKNNILSHIDTQTEIDNDEKNIISLQASYDISKSADPIYKILLDPKMEAIMPLTKFKESFNKGFYFNTTTFEDQQLKHQNEIKDGLLDAITVSIVTEQAEKPISKIVVESVSFY